MKEAPGASLLRRILGGSAATQPARGYDEPELTWRVLITLNAFRLIIAIALLFLFLAGGEPRIFGDRYPTLFAATAAGYLVFAALSVVLLRQRWAPVGVVGPAQLLADIIAVVLLMHASGGIESGLGGLLIVFLGAGSLALPLQYPVVLAAIATFAVLGQQVFANLSEPALGSNFPAAGILGGVIFAMALAAQPLARRIQASEALARKFGIDLKNISELNEYIVQHLRESILVIDADDTVRLINSSATQMLGADMPLPGTSLQTASGSLGDYVRLWRQDTSLTSHPEFALAAEGNDIRVTAHLAPLGKDEERAGPILIFLEDVSIMNARVQQSKLASLGRLSASIAHEIRNPVGAMSHAAQLLRESPVLSADDKRLTDIIQSHSERVSHIIDNVLQLSRRESSQPLRVSLKTWLEDFAAEFTATLELQEGELTVAGIAEDIEVRMDPSHLRQVLWNLCDNAVKYASETGGILVEIRAGRIRGQGRPFIEVRDRGHGIEAAMAEKIFEPFFTARSGGTGLGLYISRELCELNRATLLHLDRPDGGSIFRIVFEDPDRWGQQDEP
ncbi:MAG: ATPase [Woeseiaceae bacterium]|nr:ATPase [Woeseiaceae bacterium]